MHYNASKTNRVLEKGNIYLVDSGGQYHFGTTDVTRTISLGTESKKVKEIFTRVLKGHLNLSNFILNKNTTGSILDKIARKDLRQIKLDYAHGTGHGVGYFLNVHEDHHQFLNLIKQNLNQEWCFPMSQAIMKKTILVYALKILFIQKNIKKE